MRARQLKSLKSLKSLKGLELLETENAFETGRRGVGGTKLKYGIVRYLLDWNQIMQMES